MLSLYAEPFYLVTERNSREVDTKEKTNDTKDKKESKKTFRICRNKRYWNKTRWKNWTRLKTDSREYHKAKYRRVKKCRFQNEYNKVDKRHKR